jgi:6,7-dimethyl-8-ribityllumazine synthase
MIEAPHIMLIEARQQGEIAEELARGALAELAAAECTHERFGVPGLLEVPAAIRFAVRSLDFFTARRRFDGYVVLGCVLRSDSPQASEIFETALRSVQELTINHTLAVGCGLMMADNRDQGLDRARAERGNAGGRAAAGCLDMIDLKNQFRLFPR